MKITNDYVAILCEKGGIDVRLVRINDMPSKNDARALAKKMFPSWNVKSVQMLYRADFDEEDE